MLRNASPVLFACRSFDAVENLGDCTSMNPTLGILTLFVFVAGVGCRPARDPEIVARVGTRDIRVSDVQAEAARLSRQGGRVPDRDQLLERLIEREQLLAQARALGLDRDPGIQRAMENLLIGHLREREVENRIRNQGSQEQVAGEPASTTDSDLSLRRERHVAILQITIPEKASTEMRRRLEERIAEARRRATSGSRMSPDFGDLAVEFSDEAGSRYRGGDIGWISLPETRSRWSQELHRAAFSLPEPGAISEVIQTGRHLYLVKLMDERTIPDRGGRGAGIAQRSGYQRRRELETAFMASVRASAEVVRYPESLRMAEISLVRGSGGSEPEPPYLP